MGVDQGNNRSIFTDGDERQNQQAERLRAVLTPDLHAVPPEPIRSLIDVLHVRLGDDIQVAVVDDKTVGKMLRLRVGNSPLGTAYLNYREVRALVEMLAEKMSVLTAVTTSESAPSAQTDRSPAAAPAPVSPDPAPPDPATTPDSVPDTSVETSQPRADGDDERFDEIPF